MSGNPSVVPMTTAQNLINAGLQVTSTATPALNGTYACDGYTMSGLQAEINAILFSGATPVFSDGSTTLNWPDITKAGHSFDVAHFRSLAEAIGHFIPACTQYAVGLTATAPSNTATIP